MNNTGIIYSTYSRDLAWTDVSLQSFRKFASGFSEVVVVVPTVDLDKFLYLEKKFSTPNCPVLIKTFLEFPGKGFVHHMAMTCYADVFMPRSSFVLHMDPDCLFHSKVTPDDYFVDGKPVLIIEPYEAIQIAGHKGRYGWKKLTEGTLKFACPYETMCRHPAVHYKWIYKAMREWIESQHTTPFIDLVLRSQNEFPQDFGEFNTLGSYAWERHRDKYHFIDRGFNSEMNDPVSKVTQLWSYTGIGTPENVSRIAKILG